MGRLYVLSMLSVPINFDRNQNVIIKYRAISVDEARELLKKREFISAVGHESTAALLSELLNVKIPYNRISVYLEPGDEAICFALRARPPEGKVLTVEELRQLGFWLLHAKVE